MHSVILCKYSETKLDFETLTSCLSMAWQLCRKQQIFNFFFAFSASTQRKAKQIVNYLGHLCNIVVEFV